MIRRVLNSPWTIFWLIVVAAFCALMSVLAQ
jgi:hypothetical protein